MSPGVRRLLPRCSASVDVADQAAADLGYSACLFVPAGVDSGIRQQIDGNLGDARKTVIRVVSRALQRDVSRLLRGERSREAAVDVFEDTRSRSKVRCDPKYVVGN